jgi:predicted nucleotidyltransferase
MVAIGARANSAIEFAAIEKQTLVVVFSAQSTVLEQSRAARYLEVVARRHSLEVTYLDHDDVRRELLTESPLRRHMSRAKILYGDLDRTFPDRSRYGMRKGKPLHRPHRSLKIPSHNALRVIAQRHHLDSLKLFGSAVRTDFGPDSDVDVLFKYGRDGHPSLRAEIELERKLESMFGRDVDLVREENLLPAVRERVASEAVTLL